MNINDLPKDTAISRDEMKKVHGGSTTGTFATEIVSMSLSGGSTNEPVPTEEITLNYT